MLSEQKERLVLLSALLWQALAFASHSFIEGSTQKQNRTVQNLYDPISDFIECVSYLSGKNQFSIVKHQDLLYKLFFVLRFSKERESEIWKIICSLSLSLFNLLAYGLEPSGNH